MEIRSVIWVCLWIFTDFFTDVFMGFFMVYGPRCMGNIGLVPISPLMVSSSKLALFRGRIRKRNSLNVSLGNKKRNSVIR